MLPLFSALSIQTRQRLLDGSTVEMLQKEDTPVFVTGIDTKLSPFADRYNQNIDITQGTAQGFRVHSYFKCSVTIKKSEFNQNYAFGAGRSSGSGGALHVCQCVLDIQKDGAEICTFTNNEAAVGGAICSVSSAVLATGAKLEGNRAYKYGGAIYFQGSFQKGDQNPYLNPQVKMYGIDLKFISNKAHELGGAVAISFAVEIYFEGSYFLQNKCGFGGGAISSANCDDLKLYQCKFAYNVVDASGADTKQASTKWYDKVNTNNPADNNFANKMATHFKGRGGGAICFVSDSKKGLLPSSLSETKQHRFIRSIQCCFYKDTATTTGQTFGQGAGHEILLEGFSKLISYKDYISGYNNENYYLGQVSQYISRVVRGWDANATAWQVESFTPEDSYDACKNDKFSETAADPKPNEGNYTNETTSDFANTSFTTNMHTGNVPEPTTFTYLATPITRLPRATTSSQKPYTPPSFNIDDSSFWTSHPINENFTNRPELPPIGTTVPPRTEFPPQTKPPPPRSPNPTGFKPIVIPPGQSTSKTNSKVPSYIPVVTNIKSGGEYFDGSTWVTVIKDGEYTSYSLTYTDSEIFIPFKLDEGGPKKKPFPLALVIGIVAGLLALIIIAILIVILTKKRKEDSNSTSAVEMNEETVMQVPDSSSAPVTNDNPLWTTSVMGDTDDPFKNDFEEDAGEGFFGIGSSARALE